MTMNCISLRPWLLDRIITPLIDRPTLERQRNTHKAEEADKLFNPPANERLLIFSKKISLKRHYHCSWFSPSQKIKAYRVLKTVFPLRIKMAFSSTKRKNTPSRWWFAAGSSYQPQIELLIRETRPYQRKPLKYKCNYLLIVAGRYISYIWVIKFV